MAVILYRSNINRWCLLTSRCYNITEQLTGPIRSSVAPKPGAHFTDDFSIVIKIVTIDFLAIISLQCFAHFTTAQLVCQVKNIVTIILLEFRWEQN